MLNTCYRSRLPRGMIFGRMAAHKCAAGNGKKFTFEHYHFVMSSRRFISVRRRTSTWGEMTGSETSGLSGSPTQVAVERSLTEFRGGRPVIMTSVHESVVV